MAALPDPTDSLAGDDLALYERMTATRGEQRLGEVYVRMLNDPAIARLVGDLGGHLRFGGRLPGDVRELVILHLARRMGVAYEWAHHQQPALDAGLTPATIAALEAQTIPEGLRDDQRDALAAADAVYELRSIPADVQDRLAAAHGTASLVELAALVGLYRLIAGVVRGFAVPLEPTFTPPTWS